MGASPAHLARSGSQSEHRIRLILPTGAANDVISLEYYQHRKSVGNMAKYGIPEEIVEIVRVFYDDFKCAVEDQEETCEWFDIENGVKQGCSMSGFLFLIVMDWVMRRAVGSGKSDRDRSLLRNWMTWTLRTI